MTFHCIAYPDKTLKLIGLLRTACAERDIQFELHNPNSFDYSRARQAQPGDLLYRMAVDNIPKWQARAVEQWLLGPSVASFYLTNRLPNFLPMHSPLTLERQNVPIPKSIPHVTRNRQLLKRYSEALGGFPLILKVSGSRFGIGVMKVDSLSSLYSIVDYVNSRGDHIMLKEFIDTQSSARLVVIGDSVVASVLMQAANEEFRSNVGKKKTAKQLFPPAIQTLAVRATQAYGIEFGGVDVLFDKQHSPYVVEVNFPCKFLRAQIVSGVDIAGKMIDHLQMKAKRITG
jgi:hypothetical protein